LSCGTAVSCHFYLVANVVNKDVSFDWVSLLSFSLFYFFSLTFVPLQRPKLSFTDTWHCSVFFLISFRKMLEAFRWQGPGIVALSSNCLTRSQALVST